MISKPKLPLSHVKFSLPSPGFITESISELKKVTWPDRQQIFKLSTVVIVTSVVTAAYLGSLDYLFTWLLGLIIKR